MQDFQFHFFKKKLGEKIFFFFPNEIELKEIKEILDSTKASDSNVKNEDKLKPDTPITKTEEFVEAKKDLNKTKKEEIIKKEIKCKTKFQTGNPI